MNPSRHVVSTLTLSILAVLFCMNTRTASAQLSTAEEKGLPSNSSFQAGDVDTVNLQNGNLHISIPIVSAKQRGGGTLGWSLVYDTQAWIRQWIPNISCGLKVCSPTGEFLAGPNTNLTSGWRLTTPYKWQINNSGSISGTCATEPSLPFSQTTNWSVTDPQGTIHALPIHEEVVNNSNGTNGVCIGQTLAGPALDGSGIYYNASTNIIYLRDGTQVTPGGGTGAIIDRNGNEAGPNDTLNRPLLTTYNDPNGLYTTYTVSDSNGNSQVYRVDYADVALDPNICTVLNPPTQFTCVQNWTNSISVPGKLTLPNGKTYLFSYYPNSAGELEQITLPDGGTIGYTYTDFYQLKFVPKSQANAVGSRAVTTRTLTANGVASTWTYSIGIGASNTVTDPLGNVATHTFGDLCTNSGPSEVCSSNIFETSVAYSDSSGKTLRTVANTYADEYDPVNNSVANARVVGQTTTLDNGQVAQKLTTYETFTYPCYVDSYCPATATRLNPTQVQDYDYGQGAPGALLRTTTTAYQSIVIGATTISKPTTVTVYSGASTKASQTTYEYDNYSRTSQPMVASGAIQHSASFGTGYTTRGNITAVSRWRNTDGAMLTSTNQYDDAGNLLSTIDPMGDTTTFRYTDAWADSTCAPATGQTKAYLTTTTNANGKITASTYNSCTGTVASTTDTNSKVTTTTYDLMNRPSQNSYPDGGLTTYCYSDVEGSACYNASVESVTVTDKISASINYVDKTIFDGLGRPIQKQVTSDPEGVVYTDTVYDLDGRVSQVSNPYRSGDTEYYTTNTYDGIGRVTKVTKTDGSASTTAYTGNQTTITDEAGNNRKSVTDAIGRLNTVYENPTGLNYETDYTYDILGDLLQVTQKGGSTSSANWRTRTFAYNSVSARRSPVD